MSNTPPPPMVTPPPPNSHAATAPEGAAKNTVGLIAFIVAIVGFVFACIPGALIVGWVLLPIAFILAIVSLFSKGKKGLGISALVISIVGTIVGFVVFFAVVGDAVDDAFNEETSASTPDGETISSEDEDSAGSSRETPLPLGSTLESDDWSLTVNSVNLDGNGAVASENPFNEPAPAGQTYILVNVTLTYTGDDPAGDTPWADIAYVTADGNTINSYDAPVVVPEELDSYTTLYSGASTTGNMGFAVPADTAAQGTLAISVDLTSDKVFVAVQ